MKALSSKINLQTTRDKAILSQSTTHESPLPNLPARKKSTADNYSYPINTVLTFEKTVEEIIAEDDHYNCIVKSSQLSPFMTRFAAKAFTVHDVAITAKLPDKRYMKGCSRLFQEYSRLANQVATNRKESLTLTQNMGKVLSEYESIRQSKVDKIFEQWMKNQMPSEKGKRVLEHAIKEIRYRTDLKMERAISQGGSDTKQLRSHFDPDEKLGENTMFNSIFGSEISRTLNTLSAKKLAIAKTLRANSGKRKPTNSDFNIENGLTTMTQDDLRLKEILSTNKGGSLRLTNAIKKIGAKYIDKIAIEEAKKKKEEKKSIENFIDKIKAGNEYLTNTLSNSVSRTHKLLFKKVK